MCGRRAASRCRCREGRGAEEGRGGFRVGREMAGAWAELGSARVEPLDWVRPTGGPDAPGDLRLAGRPRRSRRGTNGVSTHWVTASFMFFDRGTFWVLPLTYLYLPRSARMYLFPKLAKLITFAAEPLVLTPFVRHQGTPVSHAAGGEPVAPSVSGRPQRCTDRRAKTSHIRRAKASHVRRLPTHHPLRLRLHASERPNLSGDRRSESDARGGHACQSSAPAKWVLSPTGT